MIRSIFAALAVASVVVVSHQTAQQPAAPPPPPGQPTRVNADALASVQFLKRVEDYVALHKKLEATLPPVAAHPTSTELDNHAQALARLIAQTRSHAKQGELLPQETRAYLRRQIGRVLGGPDGAAIRQAIMEESPGKVQLRVNARYPEGIPVSTMPAPILAALPRLPDEIEYRFIGERLILLDVHAHVVVDYMDAALQR